MDHECQKQEIISDIKRNIEALNEMKAVVIELKTLVTMLVEQGKKQDDIIKQQSETLIKINDTVIQQGAMIAQLANQQSELAAEGSIKYTQIFQVLMTRALPPIIIGGLIYWILKVVNG